MIARTRQLLLVLFNQAFTFVTIKPCCITWTSFISFKRAQNNSHGKFFSISTQLILVDLHSSRAICFSSPNFYYEVIISMIPKSEAQHMNTIIPYSYVLTGSYSHEYHVLLQSSPLPNALKQHRPLNSHLLRLLSHNSGNWIKIWLGSRILTMIQRMTFQIINSLLF